MGRLEGKVIAVTGASRGIGLAIAESLASEGARLVLVARHREALRRAVTRLPGALGFVADVTRPPTVQRLFQHIRRRFGLLDVLVNNAGVFTYKSFEKTRLEEWRKNIDTNLTSLYLTTRAALPLLVRSRSPHLVNILSISSRKAFPNCSAYTASKFGALGLTRVLAEEWRARRIRVTAILPGSTNTRMIRAFGSRVNGASLLHPPDVAQAVLGALVAPLRATFEEVVISPSRGSI